MFNWVDVSLVLLATIDSAVAKLLLITVAAVCPSGIGSMGVVSSMLDTAPPYKGRELRTRLGANCRVCECNRFTNPPSDCAETLVSTSAMPKKPIKICDCVSSMPEDSSDSYMATYALSTSLTNHKPTTSVIPIIVKEDKQY